MDTTRRYTLLTAIILFAALPATSAYLAYEFTQNPALRPLGITKEKLALAKEQTNSVSILVDVDWGEDLPEQASQDEMRALISGALSSQTDDYVFRFNSVPGDEVDIRFRVGANRYGPFAPEEMVRGIMLSLIALEVTQKARQ
ncbi:MULTISPECIES: hypothetical protein [unclassified Dinoroseobacter]|uniref:hypothetical protein n=1 Tax=unclassified Dinoroseobacter TaxID=2620028 RepID=UPI003C7BA79D